MNQKNPHEDGPENLDDSSPEIILPVDDENADTLPMPQSEQVSGDVNELLGEQITDEDDSDYDFDLLDDDDIRYIYGAPVDSDSELVIPPKLPTDDTDESLFDDDDDEVIDLSHLFDDDDTETEESNELDDFEDDDEDSEIIDDSEEDDDESEDDDLVDDTETEDSDELDDDDGNPEIRIPPHFLKLFRQKHTEINCIVTTDTGTLTQPLHELIDRGEVVIDTVYGTVYANGVELPGVTLDSETLTEIKDLYDDYGIEAENPARSFEEPDSSQAETSDALVKHESQLSGGTDEERVEESPSGQPQEEKEPPQVKESVAEKVRRTGAVVLQKYPEVATGQALNGALAIAASRSDVVANSVANGGFYIPWLGIVVPNAVASGLASVAAPVVSGAHNTVSQYLSKSKAQNMLRSILKTKHPTHTDVMLTALVDTIEGDIQQHFQHKKPNGVLSVPLLKKIADEIIKKAHEFTPEKLGIYQGTEESFAIAAMTKLVSVGYDPAESNIQMAAAAIGRALWLQNSKQNERKMQVAFGTGGGIAAVSGFALGGPVTLPLAIGAAGIVGTRAFYKYFRDYREVRHGFGSNPDKPFELSASNTEAKTAMDYFNNFVGMSAGAVAGFAAKPFKNMNTQVATDMAKDFLWVTTDAEVAEAKQEESDANATYEQEKKDHGSTSQEALNAKTVLLDKQKLHIRHKNAQKVQQVRNRLLTIGGGFALGSYFASGPIGWITAGVGAYLGNKLYSVYRDEVKKNP